MKLRFIALFSLLLVCLLYTSCSYAYSIDDFINFTSQVRGEVSNFNKSTGVILNNQDGLRNIVNGYNFTTFVCTNANYTQSFESCKLIARATPVKVNVTIGNVSLQTAYRDKSQWYEISYFNSWSIQKATYNPSTFTNTVSFGLLDLDNQDIGNWFNNWFNGKYIPPYTGPEFVPASNGDINVYQNNQLVEVATRLPYGYSFPNTATLGYLTDYIDNFYGLDLNLNVVNYSENGSFYSDTVATLNYNLYYGQKTNGLSFDLDTGRIYVSSSKLIENQLYFLTVYYKESYDSDWVYIGEKDFPFYAYLFTNVPSSGDAISPDLAKTIDPTLLATIKEAFDFSSGDQNNLDYDLNQYFDFDGNILSGDYFSGDLFESLNYTDWHNKNDYSLFIFRIYKHFVQAMRSTYTNSHITFTIHGHTYTYYASDFRTPDSPLKTYVSTIFIALITLGIILKLHRIFITMTVADLNGAVHSFDQDHSIFM